MSVHDPLLPSRKAGVLGWLKLGGLLGRTSASDDAPVWDAFAGGYQDANVDQALAGVGAFLKAHGLEATPGTVAAGLEYVSGRNTELRDLIDTRVARQEPVTTAWLNGVCFDLLHNPGDQIDQIFNQMARNLAHFSKTTRTAQRATREYNAVLSSHVRELGHGAKDGTQGSSRGEQRIMQLATVLAAMVERTGRLEDELAKSQKQALTLKKNLDTLQRKANLDHLTGLPNRRAFERLYADQVEAARVSGESLCVAFCDVDHFKRINDTHGHEAGDRVLRAIARKLDALTDEHCHVARHGGEEFVLLFRNTTVSDACAMLDQTREELAARRMVNRRNDEPIGYVTISAGVASVLDYDCPRAALEAADKALYAAKSSGRNQVCKAPCEGLRQRKRAS